MLPHPIIAVDLGTANTRIYASEFEKVIEKPSSINLVDTRKNTISDEYYKYLNSKMVKAPLRGGVIVDLKNAITLLRPLILKTKKYLIRPSSLACAPTDTSISERNLLANAIIHAGAAHVSIIPEVWAAAIGCGMDISLPCAQLLIDIGDGVTDMAVFHGGRIIFTSAVRTACSDLKKAVSSTVVAKHKIHLYDKDTEKLTHEVASIVSSEGMQKKLVHVSGIDVVKRCEASVDVENGEVIAAMTPILNKILKMIENGLKRLPEKTYCEILASGICLTGGGACIQGVGQLIASKTNMDVRTASDPMNAVINGAIDTLQFFKTNKIGLENLAWPNLTA